MIPPPAPLLSQSPSMTEPPTHRHPRRWPWLLLAAAVLLAALWAFRPTRGKAVAVDPVRRQEVVASLVVNGRVLALSKSSLGSPLVGKVAEVLVREGDRVRGGELLVRLDDAQESAAVGEARARLAQAQARLADLRGNTARASQEDLRQAQVVLANAERHLHRLEALLQAGAVSQANVDDARREADVARSRLRAAEAAARSTASGGSGERVATTDVAQARAALAAAEARLAQTRITAPAGGTILTRSVEPGDVVQPGRTLLVMELAAETLLLAQPDEKNLGGLRVGQKALASADAYPGRSFPAEVIYVSPGVDPERGTVDVKLRVPNPPDYLKTDMTLSIDLETARKPGALVVPLDSVRDTATRPWVLVAKNGRAERRDVTLGLKGGSVAEVLSGVAEGELVVRDPAVQPGARVRVRHAL